MTERTLLERTQDFIEYATATLKFHDVGYYEAVRDYIAHANAQDVRIAQLEAEKDALKASADLPEHLGQLQERALKAMSEASARGLRYSFIEVSAHQIFYLLLWVDRAKRDATETKAALGRVKALHIGAIPETTDYANGWNDCRKEARAMLQAELERTY